MAQNKTQPTAVSAEAYISAIADPKRREDCAELARLMATASQRSAQMWGPAIVGFGTHRYALANGKVGEICAVGFSSRKSEIAIYGVAGDDAGPSWLERLGKHTRGKGCLYIRRLVDVDLGVLEQMVARAAKRRMAEEH